MRTQTAVEWLIGKLPMINLEDGYYKTLIKQAKEIEKEQMCQFVSDYIDDGQDLTAEEYYEQTFKLEKL
jgi:hypothetical protein